MQKTTGFHLAKQKHKPITFKEWIQVEGPKNLSEKLDVQVTTVRHWRTGHCLPRVDQMMQIKKLTKGKISYEQIIEGVPSKGSAR